MKHSRNHTKTIMLLLLYRNDVKSVQISVYILTASSLSTMIFSRFDKVNSDGSADVAVCERGLIVV